MRRRLHARLSVLIATVCALFASHVPAGIAAPNFITVTSDADNTTMDGQVTLREAIQAAITNTSVDGSETGALFDVVVFHGSLAGATVLLSEVGDSTWGPSSLHITGGLSIWGRTDAGVTIARDPMASEMRLFHVDPGVGLTLQNLTLISGVARGDNGDQSGGGGRGGGGAGMGGAVLNEGILTLTGCTFAANVATGGETGATVAGDTSGSRGGGPLGGAGGGFGAPNGSDGDPGGFGSAGGGGGNSLGGFAGDGGDGGFGGGGGGGGGNSGGGGTPGACGAGGFGGANGSSGGSTDGGAGGSGAGMGGVVFNHDGIVSARNSTFSNNTAVGGPGSAQGFGGAICSRNGTVTVLSCTFTENIADFGGGMYVLGDGGTMTSTIDNTILANTNGGSDFAAISINGGTSSAAGVGNLMENQTGFSGTIVSTSDPLLGPPADNGGPTFTHALLSGSPAINSGNNAAVNAASLTTDQRGLGFPRILEGQVDIGAYEFPAPEVDSDPLRILLGPWDAEAGPTDPVEIEIANIGTEPLSIFTLSVGGLDSSDFVIASDTGEASVMPGGVRTVEVSYDPTSEGPHFAALEVTTDDVDEPTISVPLHGLAPASVRPLPGCASAATFIDAPALSIPNAPGVTTATLPVSGLGSYLWDVNLMTDITHSRNEDLDITLTSPAGTVVTITTDNGSNFGDVFEGTLWDDQADENGALPHADTDGNEGLATDGSYDNLVVEQALVPEEALGAFIGENPNGVWTLSISDDMTGVGGLLNAFGLQIAACAAPAMTETDSFSNMTPVPIDSAGTPLVTSDIAVTGTGNFVTDVNVSTSITHTRSGDLDVTLTSPAGTVVTLTTDNGAGNDDVFNGTTWDDSANPGGTVPYSTNDGLATDHVYVDLMTATPLVPEEALAAFNGEDPSGTWTLTVSDDTNGDGGSLDQWSLEITTTTVDLGPTGLTTEEIVQEILTRLGVPVGPDPYDVNMDAGLDAADVTENVDAP